MMKLKQHEGTPIYPDANSTLRLTYGKVGSYSPKDGVEYNYYTTLKGVMEKEDPNNYEFVVPAKLKDRNYEGLTGDIAYNPQLQRAACVDIRYTLFIIDKFAGAKHLVDEMTIVE